MDNSANCINFALVFYLCVVVKERADSSHQGHYTPVLCFGKSFYKWLPNLARPAMRDVASRDAGWWA